MFKYASIIPLIGGETLGMENAFGKRPEYILSYEAFQNHDSQLLQYYNNEVPYYLIDKSNVKPGKVDVVNSVCPCAGLSTLSTTASSTNKANDWMVETAEYVLKNVQPKVFWGENSPNLATSMGEPVVNKLRKHAMEYGYTFSLYKTKSLLHGLGQVRNRSFYFFWKGDVVPLLPYFLRDHEKIEDTIRNVGKVDDEDPMSELTNKKTPTEDPLYQFILTELYPGSTHRDIQKSLEKTLNLMDFVERVGCKYNDIAKWMFEKGFDKEGARCERIHTKLESGGNIMRRTVEIPNNRIGAFVGHLPTQLMHPDEDRFLNIRECLEIMKMPKDFVLQGGLKNLNMICQNVPVTTATDMANGVKDFLEGKLDMLHTDFVIQNNHNQVFESTSCSNTLEEFIA